MTKCDQSRSTAFAELDESIESLALCVSTNQGGLLIAVSEFQNLADQLARKNSESMPYGPPSGAARKDKGSPRSVGRPQLGTEPVNEGASSMAGKILSQFDSFKQYCSRELQTIFDSLTQTQQDCERR